MNNSHIERGVQLIILTVGGVVIKVATKYGPKVLKKLGDVIKK